jgi:hypothetical protein
MAMRVEMFRTVFDDLPCEIALRGGGDVQHAGFDTARAEASPVRLGEAGDQGIFERATGLERFAKSAEDLLVFAAIFLRQDDQSCGRQAVPETVPAAAPLTLFGFRSAETPVAAVCFTLSF